MAATPHAGSSLATLLAHHALRDGETILTALKPSIWFIALSSARFIAAVLIVACGLSLMDWSRSTSRLVIGEVTLFLIFGRLTLATLHWMSRLYVLTDQRILRVQGIFQPEVFDCPLRAVSRADLIHSTRERIFRLGTIVIQPAHGAASAQWQMIARPQQIYARVMDAISRAQNSSGNAIAAA